MASSSRRGARNLITDLITKGSSFCFFQAVRLITLGQKTKSSALVPESVRFSSKLSLSFPASQIDRVAFRSDPEEQQADSGDSCAHPTEVQVNFMGLVGPSGVLPTAYTELLINRRNQFRDGSGHAFFDIFTHRAVSLFYAAWSKYRFYIPYERGDADGFSRYLLDIVGVGLRHLRRRLNSDDGALPELFLIHYAGLLSQRPIPAANIEALVRGFFCVDTRVEQFAGQWIVLPPHEKSVLIANRNCALGQNTFLGERVWDRQTKIRLHLGPLDAKQFSRFLPRQEEFTALQELIQFCTGLTLDCEITLNLKRESIPRPLLQTGQPPRLGQSLWLNSHPPVGNADDARFKLIG